MGGKPSGYLWPISCRIAEKQAPNRLTRSGECQIISSMICKDIYTFLEFIPKLTIKTLISLSNLQKVIVIRDQINKTIVTF